MKVSTEKSKIITNSRINISLDISMNGQRFEEVTRLKYLRETLCKDGTFSAEVRVRIASAMAAMARLNRIYRCNTSFASKFKIYKSLVTTIILYRCETWTLLADSEKKDPGFRNFFASPTWSTRPMTGCRARSTSLLVHRNLLWQDQLPCGFTGTVSVKKWKLAWFGHVTCHNNLSKSISQGALEGG